MGPRRGHPHPARRRNPRSRRSRAPDPPQGRRAARRETFASWREAGSSIPLPAQHALATLEWVTRTQNLCIAGPSGTGKSHFTEALAHKAIDAGMRVAWFTLESLTAALARAAVDGTTAKTIAKITRCDLVAIDDIGMLPAGQAAAEALYRLVDAPTSAGP